MRFIFALLLSLLLASCSDKPAPSQPKVAFANTDITGLNYAKTLELKDAAGKLRTLAEFKGKVVLVFFGYTHCPDVCPTTLAEMAGVMQQLGADAERLQVLFVTVDPERDTPELLGRYVPAFHPSFIGLSGDKSQTTAVINEFKLFVAKVPAKNGDNYTIDHTAGSYVFDAQGRIRLFIRHGQGPEPILWDIRALIQGS
jgi:protein SCO1/2